MTKQLYIFLIGILIVNSCKKDNAKIDWIFVEGGIFEQGKNQIKSTSNNGERFLLRVYELNDRAFGN